MKKRKVWQDMLGYLKTQGNDLTITGRKPAEGSAAAEVAVKLFSSDGESIETRITYVEEIGRIEWQASLLKDRKKRSKFYRLLRSSGEQAILFYQMTGLLNLVRLGVDEEEGPVLALTLFADRSLPRSFFDTMLRDMQCAFLFRAKIKATLRGDQDDDMTVSLFEIGHRVGPYPGESMTWGSDNQGNEAEQINAMREKCGDTALARQRSREEMPPRVIEISEAIADDNPERARRLADGEDVTDVPELI